MSESKKSILRDGIVIFFVSLFCIALELFLTRVLNLKTFNHVVYVIIPFAMLGYGIGANGYLLFAHKLEKIRSQIILASCLLCLAAATIASYLIIVNFPLTVFYLLDFFKSFHPGLMLSLSYLIILPPFVIIGFLVLYLFSVNSQRSSALYFWDLVGAGCGAGLYFILIYEMEVFRSLIFLSGISIFLAIFLLLPLKKRWIAVAIFLVFAVSFKNFIPEIQNYASDKKGWENFPKYYQAKDYELRFSKWHPLGRTDAYHLNSDNRKKSLYIKAFGTFQINLVPTPDFVYLATNFLGGTPVFNVSPQGLAERNSMFKLFTQPMEFPYVVVDQPNVLVIGAGGGRDMVMAKSHGAKEIVAAEINPAIHSEMSPGGRLHEYSGGIYSAPDVKVHNIDGRHLVKTLPAGYFDLVILNGVDTFSGLSTGAYAYAESYLYTKNAVVDYLRVLSPNGVINFNRWFEEDKPRETLRLFAIALDALRSTGATEYWRNVIVGEHSGWGMILAKKTPFTIPEQKTIEKYFSTHEINLIYPSAGFQSNQIDKLNFYDICAIAFRDGKERDFIKNYPFDISVITDDSPFFYKFYRLSDFRPSRLWAFSNYGAGFAIFLTQGLVLFHAIVFSGIFIGYPLYRLKKNSIRSIPKQSIAAFIAYFMCLGIGFMFVEITMMQKFALLLGSPIYSISVTLSALLIFSGLGSFCIPYLEAYLKGKKRLIIFAATVLVSLLVVFIQWGAPFSDYFIRYSFFGRVVVVCLMLLPLGVSLGIFFPLGLLLCQKNKEAMVWAWGINCGFSVFGSMLAIILAQFYGFNFVLWLAILVYLIAAVSFQKMAAFSEK